MFARTSGSGQASASRTRINIPFAGQRTTSPREWVAETSEAPVEPLQCQLSLTASVRTSAHQTKMRLAGPDSNAQRPNSGRLGSCLPVLGAWCPLLHTRHLFLQRNVTAATNTTRPECQNRTGAYVGGVAHVRGAI